MGAVADKIAASRNYWIASTRPDGRPHAMPVWGVWVDAQLLFGTDRMSTKGRNIAANPAVVVHLESGDDVVVLEGKPREVTDASLLALFADAYDAKYAVRPDTSGAETVTYASARPSPSPGSNPITSTRRLAGPSTISGRAPHLSPLTSHGPAPAP